MLEACGSDVDTHERTVIACEETAHAHADADANACADIYIHSHATCIIMHALCFAAHTCDAINQSITHADTLFLLLSKSIFIECSFLANLNNLINYLINHRLSSKYTKFLCYYS